MKLTAKDIGQERYLSILRRRLTPLQTVQNQQYNNAQPAIQNNKKAPRMLRSVWTKGTDLTEEEAQEISDQIWQGPQGSVVRSLVFTLPLMFLPMLMLILLGRGESGSPPLFPFLMFPLFFSIPFFIMLGTPRSQIKAATERELSAEEIESLLPMARGRLERQYFGLVLDVLRTQIPSVSAQSDIRAALRHLGDVITRLPAEAVAVQDADTLRREAQTLRQQALQETDAFVESSLQRQAEILEQRATLAAQNGRAARRAASLRREARVQMDSLRSVLVGFQQAPQLDSASVSQLSAALHRVAGEAKSVALARQELDNEELERLYGSSLPQPQAIPVPAAPQTQTLGQGVVAGVNSSQSNPPQSPAANSGRTRPWWRNNG